MKLKLKLETFEKNSVNKRLGMNNLEKRFLGLKPMPTAKHHDAADHRFPFYPRQILPGQWPPRKSIATKTIEI
jgi:hypothetical protein